MDKYQKRGHIDAEDSDGRPIRIIYINEDEKRTKDVIKAEVEVLREFAAAYTQGEPDDMGLLPARSCRPCEIIIVLSSLHASTSDPDSRKHISVEVAKKAACEGNAWRSRGGVHVYSEDDDLAEGYQGWHRQGRGTTIHRTGDWDVVGHRYEALDNDFANTNPIRPKDKVPKEPYGIRAPF